MAQHRSVTVIGIILLLWNLMGILAFTMQYSMDLDELAQTDPLTAHAFATMPGWLWVVYAIAVGAGTSAPYCCWRGGLWRARSSCCPFSAYWSSSAIHSWAPT
jgi:hypothetical protein